MTIHEMGFGAPWCVCTPAVHRYMDEKWVGEFWSDGSIRLPTFTEFRQHPDERRRDVGEGNFSEEHFFAAPKGSEAESLYMHMGGNVGARCYMLCTSVRRDLTKFGTDYFTILNSTGFAQEIARQLPGFLGGWEGLCIYGDRRNASFQLEGPEAAALLKAARAGQRPQWNFRPDVFFAKPLEFAPELEYRFIWVAEHEVTKAVIVRAPLARGACLKSSDVPSAHLAARVVDDQPQT